MQVVGNLEKMRSFNEKPVQYYLPVGEESIHLNPFIGKHIKILYAGNIHCTHCGRKTKKSFNQGYCYPCSQRLAACDICIVRPEKCHYDNGTCREPEWAQAHCMQPHFVYLSNTSGIKVGITRQSQIPTRWIDQGASQALAIYKTRTRFQVGLLEMVIKQHMADKTNWQRMLKGEPEAIDLVQHRDFLFNEIAAEVAEIDMRFGGDQIFQVEEDLTVIDFPVERYPQKVSSLSLDKTDLVEGILEGIKGQYLIFDTGVINVRKFTGYEIQLEA